MKKTQCASKNTSNSYGYISKYFHWIMGIIIIGMIILGLYMSDLPKSDEKFYYYGLHKSFGALVLILFFARLIWRQITIQPNLLGNNKLEKRAAKAGHFVLYALMILMPLTGVLMSQGYGYDVSFFGLFVLPTLMGKNPELGALFKDMHEIFSNGLIAILVIHVAAALWHHFIRKDNTLRRMLPGFCPKLRLVKH